MAGNNYISQDRQASWFSFKHLRQWSIVISWNSGMDIAFGFLFKTDVSSFSDGT